MLHVQRSLAEGTFVRVTLSSPVAPTLPERIIGRLVELNEGTHLSCTLRHSRRDETKNLPIVSAPTWLRDRIAKHEAIRDDLLKVLGAVNGLSARAPQAGSYLFPRLPALGISLHSFVRALRVQAAVTVTPGTEFSPDTSDSIRLNFSQNHAAAVQA